MSARRQDPVNEADPPVSRLERDFVPGHRPPGAEAETGGASGHPTPAMAATPTAPHKTKHGGRDLEVTAGAALVWPPPQEELDAIEVIELGSPVPEPPPAQVQVQSAPALAQTPAAAELSPSPSAASPPAPWDFEDQGRTFETGFEALQGPDAPARASGAAPASTDEGRDTETPGDSAPLSWPPKAEDNLEVIEIGPPDPGAAEAARDPRVARVDGVATAAAPVPVEPGPIVSARAQPTPSTAASRRARGPGQRPSAKWVWIALAAGVLALVGAPWLAEYLESPRADLGGVSTAAPLAPADPVRQPQPSAAALPTAAAVPTPGIGELEREPGTAARTGLEEPRGTPALPPAPGPPPAAEPPPPAPSLADTSTLPGESVAFADVVPPPIPVNTMPVLPAPPAAAPASTARSAAAATDVPATRDTRGEAIVPARDFEAEVRQTLAAYRSAYASLDAAAASRIWPTVDERALARAFAGLKSQQIEFDRCDIAAEATAAKASCEGRAIYVRQVGRQDPQVETRRWVFTLRPSAAGWRIERADIQR